MSSTAFNYYPWNQALKLSEASKNELISTVFSDFSWNQTSESTDQFKNWCSNSNYSGHETVIPIDRSDSKAAGENSLSQTDKITDVTKNQSGPKTSENGLSETADPTKNQPVSSSTDNARPDRRSHKSFSPKVHRNKMRKVHRCFSKRKTLTGSKNLTVWKPLTQPCKSKIGKGVPTERSSGDGVLRISTTKPRRKQKPLSDVIEKRNVELYQVVGVTEPDHHLDNRSPRGSADRSTRNAIEDPIWFSRNLIKFKPCKPYQEICQCFYIINQTTSSIQFSFAIVGDPRLGTEAPDGKLPGFSPDFIRLPSYTEILQEKPYFKQPNMKFDPVMFTVSKTLGSEKLPLTKSWFQSYRYHRAKDFFSGTNAIPILPDEFLANASKENMSNLERYQEAIARFFSVDPLRGTLAALETARVCLRFRPWFITTAHAQLVCTTSVGPIRSVYLFGPCSRVNIQIVPSYIDVGECPYDAMQERSIEIKNCGRYPVKFHISGVEEISKEKISHPDFDTIYVSILDYTVHAGEQVQVTVCYLPGKPGRFARHMYVNVEEEAATRIEIRGKSVYHSVHIDLPRTMPRNILTGKNKEDVDKNIDDAVVSKWAHISQEKAKRSNIRRTPIFNNHAEFRPFAGILDFAKLPKYTLDFGLHSPSDPTLEHTISVFNPGTQLIGFTIVQTNDPLRKKLTVTFDRHSRIKPGESMNVRFALNPAEYVLGASECCVPFSIHNGPTFSVTCKIQIEQPNLEIRFACVKINVPHQQFACRIAGPDDTQIPQNSHLLKPPVVEFGTVRCGFCSVIVFQLINSGPVTCSWQAKEIDRDFVQQAKILSPAQRIQLKAYRQNLMIFRLHPMKGRLESGERCNVEMQFRPNDSVDYNFQWPIEIENSRNKILIQAHGVGMRPQLEFSNTKVTFDSIFPFTGGQEKSVVVFNPCPFPVDFYCKQLDKHHISEEDVLSRVEEFERMDQVRFPVRIAGHGLPEQVIEAYTLPSSKKGSVAATPVSPRSDSPFPDASVAPKEVIAKTPRYLQLSDAPEHNKRPFPKKTLLSQYKRKFATQREMYRALQDAIRTPLDYATAQYRGKVTTVDSRKEQFKKGIAVIIHGPPFCGKTTLAKALNKYYKIPILTLDQVILEAVEHPVNKIQHKVLNYILNPAPSPPLTQPYPGAVRSLQTPPEPDRKVHETIKSKAQTSKSQLTGTKVTGHNKGPAAPIDPNAQLDRLDPELVFQSKFLKYDSYLTDEIAELSTCVLPEDLLVQLISSRLYRQDCRRGVVFDGLKSDFIETYPAAAKAILLAVENPKRVYSFLLCNSFFDYYKRRKAQKRKRKDDTYALIIREMARLRNLSESDYNSMSRSARKHADVTIARYVAAMRLMRKRAGEPRATKKVPNPALSTDLPTSQDKLGLKGQRVLSLIRLSTIQEDRDVDHKMQKMSHRDPHPSEMSTLAPTGPKVGRGASARGSIPGKVKNKSGPFSSTTASSSTKSHRDCWNMAPQTHKDGTIQAVYKTLIYKQHKMFFSTLKEYGVLMAKWTGKVEVKKQPRSDAQRDQTPVIGKKRTAKPKDAKTKPKERTEAEKAERNKAAIDRTKARGKRRRVFGVKHMVIFRKHTKMHDNRLIGFFPGSKRWNRLPSYKTIEQATQSRLPIPKPVLYSIRKRPTLILPESEPVLSHFQFVAAAGESPPASPVLSVQTSKPASNAGISPDRVSSAKDEESTGSNVEKSLKSSSTKPDRLKTAKSQKHPVASAMTRDSGHHSNVNDQKATQPVDLAVIYPSFNRAKAFSEIRHKPITHFRWSLAANGNTTLRVLFLSEEQGKFQQTFTFQIVDYPEAEFDLSVRGFCQYTDVFADLTSIFPAGIWLFQITDERVGPVYVDADQKFYFGPLLAGRKKADVLAEHFPQHIFAFTVVNPTKVSLHIHFNMVRRAITAGKDKPPTSDFTVVPDRVVIQPKESQIIKFLAHPSSHGKCEETLLAFTEYNPAPTQIILSCLSVKPQAEVVTKNIVLDKVPVRETGIGNIEIKNKTAVIPIKWKLLSIDALPAEFIFDVREGTLKATTESQFIPVKFVSPSERPVVHVKKPFRIEFSSEDLELGVLQVENLTISGESYDLILDISFPKLLDSVLDFGVCKVHDEVVRQMTLRNKSKSECGFQIVTDHEELINRYPHGKREQLLDFQPSSGTIASSDRPLTINAICKPTAEIDVKLEKYVRCLVLDPSRGNQRVAEIPIKTIICAKYAKFLLGPSVGDMQFPCALPMQKRSRSITLQNTGDYEFVYSIKKISSTKLQPQICSFSPSPAKPKTGNTPGSVMHPPGNVLTRKPSTGNTCTTHSRKVDPAGGSATIQGVPFSVRPLSGSLRAGDVAVITVDFISDTVGLHDESFSIDISDRDPTKYPNGITYMLSGEIAIPNIDSKNVDTVFSEHMILSGEHMLNDAEITKWLVERSIYLAKRKQFLVQHTFVGSKRKLRFSLTNTSNITCPISVSLKSSQVSTAKGAKNTVEGFFIAGSSTTSIEPHQSVHISVWFAPTMAMKYQAILEVLMETPLLQANKVPCLTFELIAEAVLPNIRLTQHVLKDGRGLPTLRFSKLAVGQMSQMPLILFNDTILPIHLTANIIQNDGLFKLISDGNELAGDKLTFLPSEERSFTMQFNSQVPGKFRKLMVISCVEPICPDLSIALRGEAVCSDIDFKGLPKLDCYSRMRLLKTTAPENEDTVMERYQLFFGDNKPGEQLTADFSMVNSSGDWIRFEWPRLVGDALEITPRAGHLRPQSWSAVHARYKTLDDSQTRILPVSCSVSAITLPENYDRENVWNSDKMSLQVLSDVQRSRPESPSTVAHSADRMIGDKNSDHSVKETKHDKKDHKKAADPKKTKDKKSAKKESVSEKHRKQTEKGDKGVKRRPSDAKKDNTSGSKQEKTRKDGRKSGKNGSAMKIDTIKGEEPVKEAATVLENEQEPALREACVLAFTPEPSVITKPNTQRNILLVVSSIIGMARYECSIHELLFKETNILETRRMIFSVRNVGNIVITYTSTLSTSPEACIAFLEKVALQRASGTQHVQVTYTKDQKNPQTEIQYDDDISPPAVVVPPPKPEKGSKHGANRLLSTQASTDTSHSKESTVALAKKKRRMSKDPSGEQQQALKTPPPKIAGSARRIEAAHFRNLTKGQTANLTTAFALTPSYGKIMPGIAEHFALTFHPDDALEYKGCVFFNIENEDQRGLPLVIPVHAVGKLPLIHVNTATEANLKWSETPGHEGRKLVFNCVGTKHEMTQQLVLTNPTELDLDLKFTCRGSEDLPKPPFVLSKSTFVITSGKRALVDVTFFPYSLGIVESKWSLQIPGYNVTLPITFSATVRDPDITLFPAVLTFKPMLPKMRKTQTFELINAEAVDLSFRMNLEQFKGYDYATWEIVPLKGILKAKAKQEVAVTVMALKEFTAERVLLCNVERRSTSLRLTLEHEVLAPVVEVLYVDEEVNTVIQEEPPPALNSINLGHTETCSVYEKHFQITNVGNINVAFTARICIAGFALADSSPNYLFLSVPEGIIHPGKNQELKMTYTPRTLKDKLTGLCIVVEIEFGARYIVHLESDLYNIDVDFSFDQCDFGPVLTARDSPETGVTVPLIIANRTRKSVTIDLLSYVLPPCMAFEFVPLVLESGNSSIHTVMFLPTDVTSYTATLTFLMDAAITKTITLKGEGVEMQIELPPRMRHLHLRDGKIGKQSVYNLEVMNRSNVELFGKLVLQGKPGSKVPDLVSASVLNVSPSDVLSIPPQRSCKARLFFQPVARTLAFEAKLLFVTAQKVTKELARLSGSCPGLDVILEEKTVDFGTLVIHGHIRRTLIMKNLGEIGTYFAWDTKRLLPDFVMKPCRGYISAKGEAILEVTFAPKALNSDIRSINVPCEIPQNKAPLSINLIGSCVAIPPAKETVTFECPVRQTDTEQIAVTNSSSNTWDLRPQLVGKHWTVPQVVTIKPNATDTFETVFTPLQMAPNGGVHEGSVSLSLPTGQTLVYNLVGKTLPPKSSGKIVRDIPCRVEHLERVVVNNWLPTMQTFKVIHEFVKPDKPDPVIELGGKSYIYLPALAQVEYDFTFKALRDKEVNAVYQYRLVFKNEETGEYQYYEIQHKVIKGSSYDSKTITAPVRTVKREILKITNPLEQQITIACAVPSALSELSIDPMTCVIPGRKEADITLDYFPLKIGSAQGRIDIASIELGAFFVEINLQSTVAQPEPGVRFETYLGSTIVQTCRLLNYSQVRADFTVKVVEGTSEFQLANEKATFSLPPGSPTNPTELLVDVTFDPNQLGECRGRIVATSNTGGDFQFPLHGTSLRAKPKGPFTLLPTGEITPPMEFKNPFLRPSVFNVSVSNRVFQVKEFTESLKPKKTTNLAVTLNPNNSDVRGSTVFAQVVISPKFDCVASNEENVEWIYFINADV